MSENELISAFSGIREKTIKRYLRYIELIQIMVTNQILNPEFDGIQVNRISSELLNHLEKHYKTMLYKPTMKKLVLLVLDNLTELGYLEVHVENLFYLIKDRNLNYNEVYNKGD